MRIEIDRSKKEALYLQIVQILREQIESDQLPPLTRLPSSRDLAKELGVNRITVINAYAELTAEGLIESHVGRGTFVCEVPTALPGDKLAPPRKVPGPWHPPARSLPRYNWNPNQMIREMMRLSRQPGIISFASGTAANDFLPVVTFRKAINDVLRRDGADALQYEDSMGYYPLRQSVAAYANEQNLRATANDVLITDGCQQALDLVLRVLGGEGNTILVENPCYLGLLDIISSHRMTAIGAPTDEHGLEIDKLEPLILRYRPQLIYVTPNFQNPTGATMPLERRRALLDLAHKYNLPVLEDNIYYELYYDKRPPQPLFSLDSRTTNLVFHASSFSKMLIPGLRIGYLLSPPVLQGRVGAMKQTIDISSSALNQRALNVYLERGEFPSHLELVRNAYRIRRDAMLEAAATYFPDTAQWRVPSGGLYLWVELAPDGPDTTDLYMKAWDYGVSFAIGSVFFAYNPSQYTMRLNFANCSEEEIQEGMRRLGKAWHELRLEVPRLKQNQPHAVMPIL